MFIVPLSSTQCSIVIWAKLCNVYCPIVSILHRCWLLMWAPFVVSTTCPHLPSFEITSVQQCLWFFKLSLFDRKISTRFARYSSICFEVQLTVVERKPSQQKAPVFPTRAFTSRSGRESASFCTSWSLRLTAQKDLGKCYQIYHSIHMKLILWNITATHLLITYQSRSTFCDYCGRQEISDSALPLPQPQIGLANISLSMKAAFPEFFGIYVDCYSAKNDKRVRGRAENGIAGPS